MRKYKPVVFDELRRQGRPQGDPFSLGEEYDALFRPDQARETVVAALSEVAVDDCCTESSLQNLELGRHKPIRQRRRKPTIARFAGNAWCRITEARRQAALRSPECRDLIANSGLVTYAVKSTERHVAEAAAEVGFRFQRGFRSTMLASETVMLHGPGRKQHSQNIEKLSFVYGARENPVTLVLGFPEPNPGTADSSDAFEGTVLEDVGKYIHLDLSMNDGRPWVVPQEYVAGYYDQTTQEFVHNPHYWAAAEAGDATQGNFLV